MLIVDDLDDADKLKRKVSNLPLLREKKRQLFYHSEHVATKMDWSRIKRRKLSMFAPVNRSLDGDDINPIIELHSLIRTPDSDNEDLLIFTVPGAPIDVPSNKNLETVHKKIKSISPKLQPPKLGKIEIAHADVLIRTREKVAFKGNNEHHIIKVKEP